MAPKFRGALAVALNALVLGPAVVTSSAYGSMHVWTFLALVSGFAWVEARNGQAHDVSSGRASLGPLVTGIALLGTFLTALMTSPASVPMAVMLVGALSMVGGVALRRASMRALGSAFVSEPRPLSRRDRVRHGPYAWLEHPSELGLLAIAGGAVAVLGSTAAAIVLVMGLCPVVLLRMRNESRALAASR